MKSLTLAIAIACIPFLLSSCCCCGEGGKPAPNITGEAKSMAINAIMESPEVIDAAVVQEDGTLSLVVVVNRATSKSRAKEIGEKFVRLVKSFSKDTGIYDYMIGVYYPGKVKVVFGAKANIADHITW